MKLKHTLVLPALGLALATGAQAACGFFALGGTNVLISTNGTAAWRSIESLEGANLGTFDTDAGQTLSITGAEGKTFKNSGSDVKGVTFHYSVAATGGTHSHAGGDLGFSGNLANPGDQRWASATWAPVNLLDGLAAGEYELQVYMSGQDDNDLEPDFYRNAGGANYTAKFTVVTAVPEPSSAALLGLGGLALILRRRK